MNSKLITFNPETRKALIKGVDILADAVGSTIGPMGNNVVIETPYGATTVTKDGVTVAKQVDLQDPIQNLGAQIVKQAAAKTASVAGDGTSTSTILAQALIHEALPIIDSGVAPITIKKGYEALLKSSIKKLEQLSSPVVADEIRRIATISANNDSELGELIYSAYQHASASGLIQVEDSKTNDTFIRQVEGTHIDRGYISPYFVTNSVKQTAELENPLILITDQKFRTTSDIVPAMEIAAKANRPLVIIADEIDPASLQTLIYNKLRGILTSVFVKAPAFGDRREQLLPSIPKPVGLIL